MCVCVCPCIRVCLFTEVRIEMDNEIDSPIVAFQWLALNLYHACQVSVNS